MFTCTSHMWTKNSRYKTFWGIKFLLFHLVELLIVLLSSSAKYERIINANVKYCNIHLTILVMKSFRGRNLFEGDHLLKRGDKHKACLYYVIVCHRSQYIIGLQQAAETENYFLCHLIFRNKNSFESSNILYVRVAWVIQTQWHHMPSREIVCRGVHQMNDSSTTQYLTPGVNCDTKSFELSHKSLPDSEWVHFSGDLRPLDIYRDQAWSYNREQSLKDKYRVICYNIKKYFN